MPNYQVPPWIKGAETAANYGRGYGLGLQGGEAQSRLALEAARLSQENNRISAGFIQEQARLDIEKAYQEQKLDLARQEFASHQQEQAQHLAAEKQRMDLEAKQAANRFAAQQQFQMDINSGVDLPTAAMRYAAGMGATNLTSEVNLIKDSKPVPPPSGAMIGPPGHQQPFALVPQIGGRVDVHQIREPDEETKARLEGNAEFNKLDRLIRIGEAAMQRKYTKAPAYDNAIGDKEKEAIYEKDPLFRSYVKDRAELNKLRDKLAELGGVGTSGREDREQAAGKNQARFRYDPASGKLSATAPPPSPASESEPEYDPTTMY